MKQVCSHKKRELLLLLFLEAIPGRKGWLSFHILPPADPPSRAVLGAQQIPLSQCPAVLPSRRRGCPPLQSAAGCGGPSPCGFLGATVLDALGCTGLVCCSCQPSQGTTLMTIFSSPWMAERCSRSGLSCRNRPEGPCSDSHAEPASSPPCAPLAEHQSRCRRRDIPRCL